MPSGKFSSVSVGLRIGNLEVVRVVKERGRVFVTCLCHTCGVTGYTNEINEVKKRYKKLEANKPGEVLSCGCQTSRLIIESKKKENTLNTRKSYHVWRMMLVRCQRESYPAYKNYGARGVTVCERWQTYENFVSDMGEPPSDHDLERLDNSKGYSPDNCGWRTRRRNCNNRRTNVHVTVGSTQYTVSQAARRFGIGRSTLAYRLANGEDPSRAVSRPSSNTPAVFECNGLVLTARAWADHWGVTVSAAHKRLKRMKVASQ